MVGWSELVEVVGLVASLATAAGILLAWWQLKASKEQATTSFEDEIAREYRDIAHQIPVGALLGDVIDEEELRRHLDVFYHYIDLSNEQAFLWQEGRVRTETWANWRDGIRSNLARPAFRAAWELIKARCPDSFEELRSLEE